MHVPHGPESRRLLEKLIREILRAELQALDHPAREAKRTGATPPVLALQEVATHAAAMRTRLLEVLHSNELPVHKGTHGATLATLRHLIIHRVIDAERSYLSVLIDLRHGLDLVKLMREVSRRVEMFGVIRWCDDWLTARRTLVARVEAQLAWFTEAQAVASGRAPIPVPTPEPHAQLEAIEDDCDLITSAVDPEDRPGPSLGWHTDRNT